MTLDEWALAYALRFGIVRHDRWIEGEREFCEQAQEDLALPHPNRYPMYDKLITRAQELAEEAS